MPIHRLAIAVAAGFAAVSFAQPAPPSGGAPGPDADLRALVDEWEAWHADRVSRLAAEDGWLTLIDLAFLEDGRTTIGRAAGADLRYESLTADRIGRVIKAGDDVRFEREPTPPGQPPIVVTADGEPIERAALIADDKGGPTVLRNGPVSMILVRRNGLLALRVRDNTSPVRLNFPGIERYPFDPAFRVRARVEQPPAGATMSVTNVLGYTVEQPLGAILVFELDGREFRLSATQSSPGALFVVFGDTTNGAETHGGGRFLSVEADAGGEAIVDFNRAYNPPCAFTEFSTCELPTEGNRLPIAVRAGERAPGEPAETAGTP